ncbi:MAG: hypothetical protein ACW99A_04055 [Candidatus Kariarchaeaceae archaeon]
MTRVAKEKAILDLFNKIFDEGNVGLIDKVIHEDYNREVEYFQTSTAQYLVKQEYREPGREGFKNWIKIAVQDSIKHGVFEIKHNIRSIIIEGDNAAVQYILNWKQKKAMKDLTPIEINKPVEFQLYGSHFIEFKDNKISKLNAIWDSLTLALNLGSVVLDQEESKKFNDYVYKLKEMGLLPT